VTHCIQVLVAKRPVLEAARALFADAIVCPLPQAFALVPLTDDLLRALAASPFAGGPGAPVDVVAPAVAALAAHLSRQGEVVYAATDYFGGLGAQDAVAWHLGHQVLALGDTPAAPSSWPDSPISLALRRIGVVAGAGEDEFDALGLGRHRSNEAWAAAHRAA
jgi:hypothetical protein